MYTVSPFARYPYLLPAPPRSSIQIEIDAIMARERSVLAPPRPRRRSLVRRIVAGLRSA